MTTTSTKSETVTKKGNKLYDKLHELYASSTLPVKYPIDIDSDSDDEKGKYTEKTILEAKKLLEEDTKCPVDVEIIAQKFDRFEFERIHNKKPYIILNNKEKTTIKEQLITPIPLELRASVMNDEKKQKQIKKADALMKTIIEKLKEHKFPFGVQLQCTDITDGISSDYNYSTFEISLIMRELDDAGYKFCISGNNGVRILNIYLG